MKKPRKLSLVKYDYDSCPAFWKEKNLNIYKDFTFCYLGDIPNMPGHSYCMNIKTGVGYIFHTESIIELTEDET